METQESMFELTLRLSLPAKTLKKLKSYAMLSGLTVGDLEKQLVSQVEPELAQHFDRVLTDGIVTKLSEMDGVRLKVAAADDDQEPTEAEEAPDSHQLSGDEDAEDNKSLAEQYSETHKGHNPVRDDLAFDIRVPDAGNDAEKFLESALMSDGRGAYANRQTRAPDSAVVGAAKSFVSGRPRVRISEHTGDESGLFA